MIVKALSLWEPWAALMRSRAKRIETRSWAVNYRGPVLICAAKKWTRYLAEEHEDFKALAQQHGIELQPARPGHAVALMDLRSVCATKWLKNQEVLGSKAVLQGSLEHACGDFSDGRFGWCFEPIDMDFEPFPLSGAQGLFEIQLPAHLVRSYQAWRAREREEELDRVYEKALRK